MPCAELMPHGQLKQHTGKSVCVRIDRESGNDGIKTYSGAQSWGHKLQVQAALVLSASLTLEPGGKNPS